VRHDAYDQAVFTRIHKRWLLVLAVAAGQALVLITGTVWLKYWVSISLAEFAEPALTPGTAESNRQTADLVVGRVETIVVSMGGIIVVFSAVLTAAILRRYENRVAEVNQNLQELVNVRSRALMKSRHAVIFGLAKLAESRDDETGRHLDRIRSYVTILARELARHDASVNHEFIEILADTSSLHDIGKVGIPDAVLLKPGRLTDQERHIVRKHPLIGGDTLLAIRRVWGDDPFLMTACEIAFAHHERWDGQGYPFGLSGEDIPLAARIVALADVYDALTSKRVYKDAMSHEHAREVIRAGAGSHFDHKVVEAFITREGEFQDVRSHAHEGQPAMS
jgi:putative two-component system response regulator